ncbi:hypothetical protein A6A05_17435 [Magnetospirillum moscoviense]|uniref:Helicase/UvrB N-terminal domain-containing protein n=1 Tax=Magnetospirillum moscoviense TaxID=1437059 RepID=A0A178M8S0_9PROT|nr:hypothetical protein A6A05_17435 [Magnetospirillum moscoviense]
MTEAFFERPILNSPYKYPGRHWELVDGQPTNLIIDRRRPSDLITPVPKGKKQKAAAKAQAEMILDSGDGLSTAEQEYNATWVVNEIRGHVDAWRRLPNPDQWQVTPETARLLQHWRHHEFQGVRPFFCQIEAVETVIWLTEVAPKHGKKFERYWDFINRSNREFNGDLMRLALKLATGSGKTTVMAMLIAWQTVNAVRHPNSKSYSRAFLLVAPGITIRDRLRVLMPNDPESYYRHRELVPNDMLADIDRAKIVITNYHAFKLRERLDVSKGTRAALEGWRKEKLQTLESEGQMVQRVMGDLMGMKNVVVLNDEAHHCYREKPQNEDIADLKVYDTIINKTPLSYRTNRIIGGHAPSAYLSKLESGAAVEPDALNESLRSHCIDPALLRADDFKAFMADREKRLLTLIAKATGHQIVGADATPEEGEDASEQVLQDTGMVPAVAE